jgi:hypothetical protein
MARGRFGDAVRPHRASTVGRVSDFGNGCNYNLESSLSARRDVCHAEPGTPSHASRRKRDALTPVSFAVKIGRKSSSSNASPGSSSPGPSQGRRPFACPPRAACLVEGLVSPGWSRERTGRLKWHATWPPPRACHHLATSCKASRSCDGGCDQRYSCQDRTHDVATTPSLMDGASYGWQTSAPGRIFIIRTAVASAPRVQLPQGTRGPTSSRIHHRATSSVTRQVELTMPSSYEPVRLWRTAARTLQQSP